MQTSTLALLLLGLAAASACGSYGAPPANSLPSMPTMATDPSDQPCEVLAQPANAKVQVPELDILVTDTVPTPEPAHAKFQAPEPDTHVTDPVSTPEPKKMAGTRLRGVVEAVMAANALKKALPQKPHLLGAAKDAHGCVTTAGYIWSEAKGRCVRPWEEIEEAPATAGFCVGVPGCERHSKRTNCVAGRNCEWRTASDDSNNNGDDDGEDAPEMVMVEPELRPMDAGVMIPGFVPPPDMKEMPVGEQQQQQQQAPDMQEMFVGEQEQQQQQPGAPAFPVSLRTHARMEALRREKNVQRKWKRAVSLAKEMYAMHADQKHHRQQWKAVMAELVSTVKRMEPAVASQGTMAADAEAEVPPPANWADDQNVEHELNPGMSVLYEAMSKVVSKFSKDFPNNTESEEVTEGLASVQELIQRGEHLTDSDIASVQEAIAKSKDRYESATAMMTEALCEEKIRLWEGFLKAADGDGAPAAPRLRTGAQALRREKLRQQWKRMVSRVKKGMGPETDAGDTRADHQQWKEAVSELVHFVEARDRAAEAGADERGDDIAGHDDPQQDPSSSSTPDDCHKACNGVPGCLCNDDAAASFFGLLLQLLVIFFVLSCCISCARAVRRRRMAAKAMRDGVVINAVVVPCSKDLETPVMT